MPYPTNAKQHRPTPAQDSPREARQPRDKRKSSLFDDNPLDRNKDGFVNADDLLIAAKEAWQWVFSWRGAMVVCGGFTVFAGSLNIASWTGAMGSAAAGILTWGVIQVLELMPTFDSLNLKSNLAALVRLQRKPTEIPTANEMLNPGYKKRLRAYQHREKNQDQLFEGIRWVCYGLEFFVLVIGGGILSATGVSWSAVLLALVGMFGVELGLRLTNICAEKLMSSEEREYIKSIEAQVRRTSVTLAE
jgi:hypothetical protein